MKASDNAASKQSGTRLPLLLTVSIVSSLIMLDTNVVAVSLPTVGQSLHANFAGLQWVISAYVLSYAALLMAAGNLADLYGRRAAMLVGLAIFAAASGACGLAPTLLLLNLGRAAQGIGGALLLTSSMAIISHEFDGPERASAFAFWGASMGLALAIGPVLGGVITSLAGWRWIFLMNVPLGIILILSTLKAVSESRNPKAKKLDYLGIVTFSTGLGLLIWALIDGNDAGWGSASILARLAAALVFVGVFVVVERRGKAPMVELDIFKTRTFLGAIAAMAGYGASAQVMVFFLPQMLQNAYRFSPLIAGLGMIPFALPMVVAPRLMGPLTQNFCGRTLLAAGLLVSVIGNICLWLAPLTNQPYAVFACAMAMAGCGAGLLNGETIAVISMSVPADRAGEASGIASTTRYLGILVAVAVLGSALSNRTREAFMAQAANLGQPASALLTIAKRTATGDISGALAKVPPAAHVQLDIAARAAFASGFSLAALSAAAAGLLACGLTFWLVDASETAPKPKPVAKRPCHLVDCRHPI